MAAKTFAIIVEDLHEPAGANRSPRGRTDYQTLKLRASHRQPLMDAQFFPNRYIVKRSVAAMTIWVNEQLDPSGIVYACIACCNETQAKECHDSFQKNLTVEQKMAGWIARMRTVTSWDDVPVSALKLS